MVWVFLFEYQPGVRISRTEWSPLPEMFYLIPVPKRGEKSQQSVNNKLGLSFKMIPDSEKALWQIWRYNEMSVRKFREENGLK